MTMLAPPPETKTRDESPDAPAVQSLVASWYAGTVGRREFIARGTALLGSLAAATTLLAACTADPASATATVGGAAGSAMLQTSGSATTAPGVASTLVSSPAAPAAPTAIPPTPVLPASQVGTRVPAMQRMTMFKNGNDDVMAYETRPTTGPGPFPAIIVIHENMGLTEHIQDVTRRCAAEGFIGFGMDYLSRLGGTMSFNTPQDVTAGINRLTDDQIISDTTAAVQYLKANGATKVGVVGFCWGGRRSILVGLRSQGIDAIASYYGGGLPTTNATMTVNVLDEVRTTLKVPLLGNYGAMDPGIPATVVDTLRDNALAAGVPVNVKLFEATGHAFNNDTRPMMGATGYNAASAAEAWGRTLAWFRTYLT